MKIVGSSVPLCTTCKWRRSDSYMGEELEPRCTNPLIDPAATLAGAKVEKFCTVERRFSISECGPQGKLWEPKHVTIDATANEEPHRSRTIAFFPLQREMAASAPSHGLWGQFKLWLWELVK